MISLQTNETMDGVFSKRLLELSARDSRDNIPLATAVIIIITFGVIGNTIAFIFYGFKERRTITNFLIAVLAFNDLIVNIVFYDETFFHFQPFKFTNTAGCKILYVVNNWVLMNSVSLMLVIAVERYRKICHPFSWQFTNLSARVATVCVTVTTLVVCSKEAIFAEIVPEHILMNDNSTVEGYVCVHSHDKKLKPFIKGSNFLTMAIYVGLFASIITVYSLIIRKLYLVNKASSSNKNNFGRHEGIEMKQSMTGSSSGTTSTVDSTINESHSDCKENDNSTKALNTNEQTSLTTRNMNDPEQGQVTPERQRETKRNIKAEMSLSSNSEVEGQRQTMIAKQKNNPQNKLAEVEKKITKMIIVIAIASVLSFVPYFLVILLVPSHYSTEDKLSNMKKKVFRESYKFNGVINPYIMCIFSANFRQFIKGIFCRCCSKK